MIELIDLEKYDIREGIYEKFRASCNIDTDLTIASWMCEKTTLNGQPFGFSGYEYLIQPAEDLYPRQVIVKPAQVGASEIMARKMFAILYRYGLTPHYYEENGVERCVWGISGIYSFPDYDSLRKFSKDRIVTDIVKASSVLAAATKLSGSESMDQIGIFDSFCYMLGRKSDAANQSIPAEIIMKDEGDRPLNGDRRIATALNARVQNARIFGNDHYRGLIIEYGTPTFPDETGILLDGMYFLSDQGVLKVKCSRCNHYQEIKYPDSIAYFYEKGQKPGKKDPYWMCLKCKKALDWSEIGKWHREEPLKTHNMEWVKKYPSRTKDGDGIRGYRIPFATQRNTAKRVLMKRDTDYKASMADFYNYGLGTAYRDNAIGLGEEDFTKCRVDECHWDIKDDSTPYIMAFDQGAYLAVAGLKPNSQTDMNPFGTWQLVWCEYIKDSEAFSKIIRDPSGNLEVKKGELAKRIDYWNPEVVVGDHLPNAASAEAEAEMYKEVMWLCDSKGNAGMARVRFDEEDAEGNIVHKVLEHKHLAIDEYFQQIKAHRWEYPLNPEGDQFDTFKAHHKNVKKLVDAEKGTFTYESFGEDHYCQAGKLLSEAAELFLTVRPRSKHSGLIIIGGFQFGGPRS